jgi:hypothetical protein
LEFFMRNALFVAIAIGATALSSAQTKPPADSDAHRPTPNPNALVGNYRFESGLLMKIEHSDGQFYAQTTGQPRQSLSATDGRLTYATIPAYLTFDMDNQGVARIIHFHFDDRSSTAKRIDAASAQKVADALALKIKDQRHDPACATTLRRLVEELRAGQPDYSKMTLSLARATRTQLPTIQANIRALGALQDVKFTSVDQSGNENFAVAFENGSTAWRLFCLPGGYVSSAAIRPTG